MIVTLHIEHNNLGNLNALAGKTSIHNLYASYCNLTDISGLSADTGLSYLDLSNNSLTSIAALVADAASGGLWYGAVILSNNPGLLPAAAADETTLQASPYNVSIF
jgi:hypothetical protein